MMNRYIYIYNLHTCFLNTTKVPCSPLGADWLVCRPVGLLTLLPAVLLPLAPAAPAVDITVDIICNRYYSRYQSRYDTIYRYQRVDTAPAGRRRPAHHALRRPRPRPRGLGPRQQRGHGLQAEGVRHALGLAPHQPIRGGYCEVRCEVTNHSSPGAASARPPAPGRSPPARPRSRPISPRTATQHYNMFASHCHSPFIESIRFMWKACWKVVLRILINLTSLRRAAAVAIKHLSKHCQTSTLRGQIHSMYSSPVSRCPP